MVISWQYPDCRNLEYCFSSLPWLQALCVCLSVSVCVCVCVHMWVCVSVCLSVYLSVYLSVCLSVLMCTFVKCISHMWVNIYIYIHPLNYGHNALLTDVSQRPSTVKLGSVPPSSVYAKSQSHPRYVSAHVSNSRSKTNPIMTSNGFSAVEKSLTSPKRKISEPFSMFYGIHWQKLNTPSVRWVHIPTYVLI